MSLKKFIDQAHALLRRKRDEEDEEGEENEKKRTRLEKKSARAKRKRTNKSQMKGNLKILPRIFSSQSDI